MKKIIIVGGGFGGLSAARILSGKKEIEIKIIDQRNYHLFQPLLYQVASAALSPADIAVPIRSLFSSSSNVEVIMSKVENVNLGASEIQCSDAKFSFDYLILACGVRHSYFGHDNWEEAAPGLKTLEQATEIRRRVLLAFEKAEKEKDLEIQKSLLTFVVVGGGPTGVELAGALSEISRQTLKKDFRNINPEQSKIILIEGAPRLLASFHEKLSLQAFDDLVHMGVEVRLQSLVTQVDAHGVKIGDEFISAQTVLWAAGVQAPTINSRLGLPLDKSGRVIVKDDLSLASFKNVFVIGDQASFSLADGKTLPGLAPVAMQQGRWAAKNILRDLKAEPRLPFEYSDKGLMATIGRKKAVAQLGKMTLTGFPAWLAWLVIHIYFLIGFRNRLFVFLQWIWAYFTFNRGARLIVEKEWRSDS